MAKLPKTLGFGMGLEFRESANVLSATNTTPLQAGMVLNVAIGGPHPYRTSSLYVAACHWAAPG